MEVKETSSVLRRAYNRSGSAEGINMLHGRLKTYERKSLILSLAKPTLEEHKANIKFNDSSLKSKQSQVLGMTWELKYR